MNELISTFKEVFEYKDGSLFWKTTRGTRAIKGSRAGKLRKDGYRDVGLNGKYYLEHRVIYAILNNELPEVIDHIDHNRSNNLIDNLRIADYASNAWNSRLSRNNSSGIKGIRETYNQKYEARLAVRGKTIQIGTFDNIEDAKISIENARNSIHNQYACHG